MPLHSHPIKQSGNWTLSAREGTISSSSTTHRARLSERQNVAKLSKNKLNRHLHIAIEFQNESLTYRDLDHRANQLANWLRARGIKPGVPVGIYLEHSPETIVALLGVLKRALLRAFRHGAPALTSRFHDRRHYDSTRSHEGL